MSASKTENSFMDEDHSDTISSDEIEDSSMHEDDSNRKLSSSDEQAIGEEESNDAMSPSDDEVVPDRIEYQRMLSWPEGISASSDIIALFNEVAASMPPYSHPTQAVLFRLPDLVRMTGQTRLASQYGEAFCRRMLKFIKLLLEHDQASATLGAHGTLHSLLSSEFLYKIERFHTNFKEKGVVRQSVQRQQIQATMEEEISWLRSDAVAAKRILRSYSEASLRRDSKLHKPSLSNPTIGRRMDDFRDLMSTVVFESCIDLKAFPRVETMHSLYYLIRNIKFPRDWTLDTAREDGNDDQSSGADSDGQGGSANSVAFGNTNNFVNIDEVSIVPASAPEEPVTDAFRSVIRKAKGLENLRFETSEAVIAWRTSACQALSILSSDFGFKSSEELDQAIPQLLATALALSQVEDCYWACDAMSFVVMLFRDKLQRASTSVLDRLNLIYALGALTIIFREANISESWNEKFQPASLAAEEAIELLRPLYEHNKARHRHSLAALQIEYGLCVLLPEKREVSALESGRRAVKEAVELCQEILSENSTGWESKLLLARVLQVQAMLRPHVGDEFDRRKVAEEALDHLRDVTKIKPGPFDLKLADAVHSFASLNIIDSRSALSEAETIYKALSTVTPGQFDTKLSEVRRWLTR
ncbi:hypothetical protein A4X13_0g3868 [Tilletia indica]|uniref:Uncharacterized protein n=1 Tax=Tilletia indica TaxID=43049 RepID=A0A177TGV8_9BASI|nr:hypothetical protein A4X13_0g3868 [Tilletia indica]